MPWAAHRPCRGRIRGAKAPLRDSDTQSLWRDQQQAPPPMRRGLLVQKRGLTKQALMCYKSLESRTGKAPSVHSPEGMATAWRYQAGPQTFLARRPTDGTIDLQLKIVLSLSESRPDGGNRFFSGAGATASCGSRSSCRSTPAPFRSAAGQSTGARRPRVRV
jgi:hypothetical protein